MSARRRSAVGYMAEASGASITNACARELDPPVRRLGSKWVFPPILGFFTPESVGVPAQSLDCRIAFPQVAQSPISKSGALE